MGLVRRRYLPWILAFVTVTPFAASPARAPVEPSPEPPAVSATALDPPAILVSRQLLAARGLAVGEVVQLTADPAGAGSRPFRIAGIYEPVPDPMRLTSKRLEVRLHLPELLELTARSSDASAKEAVSAINVRLADPTGAHDFAQALSQRLPGLVAAPTASNADTFVVLERFHLAIAIVTVLGGSAFLLALMVMRADERRETTGILRLIGFTRRRILLEVLVEGLCIAVAGALFGVITARLIEDVFNVFFQWRYDTALVFVRVTAGIAWRAVVLAVPLGVLAGLVASWTILRRDVVELMRR